MTLAILLAFLLGFFGSVPVAGPLAALILAYAVEGRRRAGVLVAVGGALAEAGYVFLACWGLSSLFERYPMVMPVSRLLAACVLIPLGVLLARGGRGKGQATSGGRPRTPDLHAAGHLALGFSVIAFNPTLLATWSVAIGALLASDWLPASRALPVVFALSAAAGIVCWFAILLTLVARGRHRLTASAVDRIMQAIGGMLAVIGIALMVLALA